ncbi:restriction endonuclease subunit S [Pasteurella sp. PK-2025]|uniref:restriction endonuclease subunit S n=1 Tax=unclassified Pasteurella TaxID=2621516 RepID=UPI003C77F46F
MFKQYQEYKNSGVEWLGDVPKHWEIVRTKHIYNYRQEPALQNDEIITAFRDGQVTLRKYRRTEGFTNSIQEHGYQHIHKGDLVIHEMDAFAGTIGIAEYSGKSTPVYTVLYPNQNLNNTFFCYFFRTMALSGYISSLAKGIRVRSTDFRWATSKNVPLVFPPLAEQTQIADYLDSETQKIDQLIAKQEKLIALLEEQRKSIISHAVTKGLNPNAAMKDSGVEWLGEVPEHWVVGKIKNLTTKIGSGKTPLGGAAVYTDFGILFLRSQNIFNNGIDITEKTFISESIDNEMKNTRVLAKDILLNITGGSIGRCCIYPDNFPPANVNQHVCIIRCNDKILPEMMHFFWISSFGQTVIALQQTGANREGMNFYQIANTSFPIPPITEQNQIVNYLEKENQKIDKIIQKQTALIEKLKEYRASIIAHAVTGKIDVRKMENVGWALAHQEIINCDLMNESSSYEKSN